MTKKAFGLLALVVLLVSGCKKGDLPQESYYFTFKVKIDNRITEPTIVNGFYGTLIDKNGKVKSKKDTVQENTNPIARNAIYLFETEHKDEIEKTALESKGKTVYSLKKIQKADIKPKFIIIPNKHGFFQFDTSNIPYLALIRVKGNLAYNQSGLVPLPALTGELIKLDLILDY